TRYHTIEERIRGYTGPAEGRYGCMFWTGGLWKCDGYPMMTGSHGKQGRAGRVIMATKPGRELKPTELVLHKPDVCSQDRRCVNPDHLYIGDAKQNAADRTRSGKSGRRWKLNDDKAREICRRHDADESSLRLAEAFGVGLHTIRDIVRGVSWFEATGRTFIPMKPGRPPNKDRLIKLRLKNRHHNTAARAVA